MIGGGMGLPSVRGTMGGPGGVALWYLPREQGPFAASARFWGWVGGLAGGDSVGLAIWYGGDVLSLARGAGVWIYGGRVIGGRLALGSGSGRVGGWGG
ncbi:hypothetical protein Tco_0983343 [Tanacetum coccineum]